MNKPVSLPRSLTALTLALAASAILMTSGPARAADWSALTPAPLGLVSDRDTMTLSQSDADEDMNYIGHYSIFFEPGAPELDLGAEEVISLAVEHAIAADASHVVILANPDGVNTDAIARNTAYRLGRELEEVLKAEGLPDYTRLFLVEEAASSTDQSLAEQTDSEETTEPAMNRLEIAVFPAGSTFPMQLSWLLR